MQLPVLIFNKAKISVRLALTQKGQHLGVTLLHVQPIKMDRRKVSKLLLDYQREYSRQSHYSSVV
jgi:hypothetical protein